MINIEEIKKLLPHRYPFLMIDKVIDIEIGKSLLAVKNVSCNEPYFTGHFPKQFVMPGVLIIEALAQATGILAFKSEQQLQKGNNIYMLVGIENVRFKKIVRPGDQLILKVKVTSNRHNIWKFNCEALVDDQIVTSPVLMCTKKEYEK